MGKSWVTTLFGLIAMAAAVMTTGVAGEKAQKVGEALVAVSAGAGLIAAKDSNVTGGTKPQ